MGQHQSSAVGSCLEDACAGRLGCVVFRDDDSFQGNDFYNLLWAKPYNKDSRAAASPFAVTQPMTADEVSKIVKCATANKFKVQAKSGGHSYANYGLGGPGGNTTITIDLVKFQNFTMDTTTWYATVGAGYLLGGIDTKLHENGNRAMAHGVCPGVGLGGHATIGGLGPASRMWGPALDHVVEVEVVTADGKIQRASDEENPDLFKGLKGAGASFGVITEFVLKTHPEPANITQYSYSITLGKPEDMAPIFKQWQDVVSDANLDRRFASEFIITPIGSFISGTYYGDENEFKASGIIDKLPHDKYTLTVQGWLGALAHDAENDLLLLSNAPSSFYSKSLGFKQEDLLTEEGINSVFRYIHDAEKGSLAWVIIFDLASGATNDVAMNATAYAHRDKIMFYQSYAIELGDVSDKTRNFITGFDDAVRNAVTAETNWTTYAGYVDPALGTDAQPVYWGSNYPELQKIKAKWDQDDIFHNYQSVRPAKS